MQLSEHFSFEELTHTDHREFDNTPNDAELANLVRLAAFLEEVKTLLGGKPVMVNSAFRSKQVNDAVGSKDTSQHRVGCAADLRIPGMTPDEVVRTIIAPSSHHRQDWHPAVFLSRPEGQLDSELTAERVVCNVGERGNRRRLKLHP